MSDPASIEKAKALLAEAAQREASEVPDDASMHNWSTWGSLVHMRLILAIEAHLGHEIPPEEVVEITSLEDVVGVLEG